MRIRAAALAIIIAITSVSPSHAAQDVTPPPNCAGAKLTAPLSPSHDDQRRTPVLLVHGFTADDTMWGQRVDRTITPHHAVTGERSIVDDAGNLRGSAVYSLDYHSEAHRWFTQPGAGGESFLRAARCLVAHEAFTGHQLVVVAHSMGGLITRWALNEDAALRDRTSLVVTLGTPYEGSWAAAAGAVLLEVADAATARYPVPRTLKAVFHLMVVACRAKSDLPGCDAVRYLDDLVATGHAFVPGSPELRELAPWPPGPRVHQIASNVVMGNAALGFFFGAPTALDVSAGDWVVGRDSATSGDHAEHVAECRYDMNPLSILNDLLTSPGYTFSCWHNAQPKVQQVADQVRTVVATELARYDAQTYAYLTNGELVLMRDAQRLAAESGRFNTGDPVTFTEDGRFAVTISYQEIVTVDRDTGRSRRIRCGCQAMAPAGNATLTWINDRHELYRVDLASAAEPSVMKVSLPARSKDTTDPPARVLAGARDHLLIAVPTGTSAYGGPEELYVMKPDGTTMPLGSTEANLQVLRAAGTYATDDGVPRFAYVAGWHSSSCHERLSVTMVDVTNGQLSHTSLPDDKLKIGGNSPEGGGFTDLWWGRDGQLYGTFQNWSCDGTDQRDLAAAGLWRWDPARSSWTAVDVGPLLTTRQLGPRTKAVVVNGRSSGTGTLYLEVDGQGTQVATGVRSIAMPPASQVDKRTSPGTAPCDAALVAKYEPGATVAEIDCEGAFALVRFDTPRGTRTHLFGSAGVSWRPVVAGSASQGALTSCDVSSAGLAPTMIETIFPGRVTTAPPDSC